MEGIVRKYIGILMVILLTAVGIGTGGASAGRLCDLANKQLEGNTTSDPVTEAAAAAAAALYCALGL